MLTRVEPFFRFLFTHALGALACFLSTYSLFSLTGPGRIIPLLLLLVGLYLAWHYRQRTPQSRDGIIATLYGPILVAISYQLCLSVALTYLSALPEIITIVYGGGFAWSIAILHSAGKGRYWRPVGEMLKLMIALGPLTFISLSSRAL